MAKPKPTHVIRHEIVLGKVEREMAEALALSKTASNLVIPAAVGVGTVGVALASYGAYQWFKDHVDTFEDILETTGASEVIDVVTGEKTYAAAWWSQAKGTATGERIGPVWAFRKLFGR